MKRSLQEDTYKEGSREMSQWITDARDIVALWLATLAWVGE